MKERKILEVGSFSGLLVERSSSHDINIPFIGTCDKPDKPYREVAGRNDLHII